MTTRETNSMYCKFAQHYDAILYPKELTMNPGFRKISHGDVGRDVLFWNKLLGNNANYFDTDTLVLTKCFQNQHNLTVDGIVGPITWETAINSPMYAERYARLYKEMYGNCAPEVDTKGLNIKWTCGTDGNWSIHNIETGVWFNVPKKGSDMFKMYQIALYASHELDRRKK